MSDRWKAIVILIFLLPIFIYEIIRYFTLPDKPVEDRETVEVYIPRGSSLRDVADTLEKKGLVERAGMFVFWARTMDMETRIPFGRFRVPVGLTYAQLVEYLANTPPQLKKVTLIEGWSSERILRELQVRLDLDSTKLHALFRDPSLLQHFGIPANDLTGYLLPDTYVFAEGVNEEEVITYLVQQAMNIFKPDSVQQQLKKLNFTIFQVLTLASIVEGEAVVDSERTIIASVYLNRLRRGMRLQADPTIQFIIPDGPRRLTYRDLKIDSPYNTYLYKGMPPGPINNPGKASILATLFAAKTNYLYFVARGDGSHIFSRTAEEHKRAKRAFNRIRRRVYGY